MSIDSSAIINLLSAIAALSAVGLAVASELRAQKRFKQSNEIQTKIAATNIKPLVFIHQHVTSDRRRVTLHNDGVGPAVMTKIVFTRGNRSGSSIPSILDTATGFKWDFYYGFGTQGASLRAGDHRVLLELSVEGLKGQGWNDSWVQTFFKRVDTELKGIKISIELEDVLGNKQPTFETTLD